MARRTQFEKYARAEDERGINAPKHNEYPLEEEEMKKKIKNKKKKNLPPENCKKNICKYKIVLLEFGGAMPPRTHYLSKSCHVPPITLMARSSFYTKNKAAKFSNLLSGKCPGGPGEPGNNCTRCSGADGQERVRGRAASQEEKVDKTFPV